ncbi:hypothetical protein SAMD00023518_00545 [Listeria monocytogenes]|nr:hypothetical protein SAMD00023518_00545 [Listeria monocytogenes]
MHQSLTKNGIAIKIVHLFKTLNACNLSLKHIRIKC